MKFTNNEDAVSPVIGVILMVAITVILAAVIAAFVFGMAGNVQKTRVVSFTCQQVGATVITCTDQGGQDQEAITGVWVAVAGNSVYWASPVVGGNNTPNRNATTSADHVVITGMFNDGKMQVLLDTNV